MRILALAAALPAVAVPLDAHAEGEVGPMVGLGVVGTRAPGADDDIAVAGVGAELVFWYHRVGIAAEGSRQWSVGGVDGPQVGSVAGSVRVLAFDHVMPSLLDPREVVELGIELHGIVERAWWRDITNAREPWSYGFGAAIRLRGASDDDRSNLLAESRLFVRAMYQREAGVDFAARDLMPGEAHRGVAVMFGLGAQWGGGQAAYVETLRRRNALDSEWLVR